MKLSSCHLYGLFTAPPFLFTAVRDLLYTYHGVTSTEDSKYSWTLGGSSTSAIHHTNPHTLRTKQDNRAYSCRDHMHEHEALMLYACVVNAYCHIASSSCSWSHWQVIHIEQSSTIACTYLWALCSYYLCPVFVFYPLTHMDSKPLPKMRNRKINLLWPNIIWQEIMQSKHIWLVSMDITVMFITVFLCRLCIGVDSENWIKPKLDERIESKYWWMRNFSMCIHCVGKSKGTRMTQIWHQCSIYCDNGH